MLDEPVFVLPQPATVAKFSVARKTSTFVDACHHSRLHGRKSSWQTLCSRACCACTWMIGYLPRQPRCTEARRTRGHHRAARVVRQAAVAQTPLPGKPVVSASGNCYRPNDILAKLRSSVHLFRTQDNILVHTSLTVSKEDTLMPRGLLPCQLLLTVCPLPQ